VNSGLNATVRRDFESKFQKKASGRGAAKEEIREIINHIIQSRF